MHAAWSQDGVARGGIHGHGCVSAVVLCDCARLCAGEHITGGLGLWLRCDYFEIVAKLGQGKVLSGDLSVCHNFTAITKTLYFQLAYKSADGGC